MGGGFVCQREGDGFHHGSRLAGESARDNGRMAVGDWDGSPHPRGQWERGWSPASVFAGAGSPRGDWGWVPASARTMEEGMESRLRLCGGRLTAGGLGWGWVPASARTTGEGMESRLRLCGGRLTAGGLGRGWVPASARTMEEGMESRLHLCGGRLTAGGGLLWFAIVMAVDQALYRGPCFFRCVSCECLPKVADNRGIVIADRGIKIGVEV